MPALAEYVAEIAPLWESRWLTNMGPKHRELEAELRGYLGVPHVRLFTNGHLALECVLEALGLGRDGRRKVVTTPYTFASTTHAIVRKGLEPAFADVDPATLCLDPRAAEALVDDDTCAIVAVHVYGIPCDVGALAGVARRHGLALVYDAAHAFGVEVGGVPICSFGDASMLSFHATKVFNTVEGGAVCFSDPALATPLERWRNFGIEGPEDVAYAGGNAKMDELRAAMGLVNLRHADDEIALRGRADARYRERLAGVPGLRLPEPPEGTRRNFSYMPVLFGDSFGATRDEVAAALAGRGVYARKYFYPLTSAYACYAGRFVPSATPVALDASLRVLTLPMYSGLTEAEVDLICDVVLGCRR